jgi:hypothetical protein
MNFKCVVIFNINIVHFLIIAIDFSENYTLKTCMNSKKKMDS